MKEEVQRISRLVAEGKLSPEDAADLIDAFYSADRPADEPSAENRQTPPPPPPGAEQGAAHKDPLKGLLDSVEKLTKESFDAVNWPEVSRQARDSAKKGFESLKAGLEDLSKGKVHLGWLTATETREVSLPLSIGTGKSLKVENPCGNVKIVGGFDVGTVTAHAKFRGATLEDSKARAAEFSLLIEESDHVILIRQPDVTGTSVDLEIQLPGQANVDLRVVSGNVSVLDTGGSCRVSSRSGNVALRGLNGLVEVSSESGNLSIEDSESPQITVDNKSGNLAFTGNRGNINARTASGDVTLSGGTVKVVSLESVSGNARVEVTDPVAGTLNVRTVSGNVRVIIPDGSDCRVSLSTMRGHVSSLPLQDEAKVEHRVTGRLGAGTGSIEVSAITGDVTLGLPDSTQARAEA